LNNNRVNQSDNSNNDHVRNDRDGLYGISYDINISDYENNLNEHQYRFDNHYTESIDDSRHQNIIARNSIGRARSRSRSRSRSVSFDRNDEIRSLR
jgi:hypothetical protein